MRKHAHRCLTDWSSKHQQAALVGTFRTTVPLTADLNS